MSKRDGLTPAGGGEFKRGRLSYQEMGYIRTHAHGKPVADIVAALNRSPDVVNKFIKDHVPPPKSVTMADVDDANRITIRQELRTSEAWKALKAELFTDELKFFEEGYLKMMNTLEGNFSGSEETQVFHSVKYEVLMSRNLKQRKAALEDIGRLEVMRADFLGGFGGLASGMSDEQREFAAQMETNLNIAKNHEKSLTTEYAKLQERHADLMKQLKTTRDQRVKQLDAGIKNGFLSVIKELTLRDQQEKQGRQLKLVQMAGQKEYERLGRPRAYEDGSSDNPILSPETVDLGPEDEPDVAAEDPDE